MPRTRMLGVAAVLALLITGCGTGTTTPPPTQPPTAHSAPKPPGPPTISGTPLPVVVDASTPRMLTNDQLNQQEPVSTTGSTTDQIVSSIRHETLKLAGVSGTITASCPSMDYHDGALDTCHATFDGVPIDWAVTISSAVFVTYQLTPDNGILTAGKAYAQFWSGYQHRSDHLTCDTIPPVVSVKLDPANFAPTGYRCAYLGQVQDNTRTWTYLPVTVDGQGDIGA